MTDHSLIALLVVAGSALQLAGLVLLGIMAWQGRALMLESQRLTKRMEILAYREAAMTPLERVKARLNLLTWLAACNLACTIAVVWKVFTAA